jgi:capsular polysaccharide biosynthesis protein
MYGDIPFGLFVVSNAIISGNAGVIHTKDRTPILEQNAVLLRKGEFILGKPRRPQAHHPPPQEAESLLSLVSCCHHYFWHWMMDSMPKVFIAEACGFKGSYLLPPKSVAPWASECLELLRIESTRLRFHEGEDMHVETLFVPTYFCGFNAHHNAPFMREYRKYLLLHAGATTAPQNRRIFIARRSSVKTRRVLNQARVEEILSPYGFSTVYFENLSLREQITLAAQTEAMVAPHGSGLVHSLCMPEGSLLIELFPARRQLSCDCYEMLSSVPDHHYTALVGDIDRLGDIEVNEEALQAVCHDLFTQRLVLNG